MNGTRLIDFSSISSILSQLGGLKLKNQLEFEEMAVPLKINQKSFWVTFLLISREPQIDRHEISLQSH